MWKGYAYKDKKCRGHRAANSVEEETGLYTWTMVSEDIREGATAGKVLHEIVLETTLDVLLDYNTQRIMMTQAYFPKKEVKEKAEVDDTIHEDNPGMMARLTRFDIWGGIPYEQPHVEDMKQRTKEGTAIVILPGETVGMRQAGKRTENAGATHTEHAYGLNPNRVTKELSLIHI